MADEANILFSMPAELKTRARRLAKTTRSSLSQICRDALRDKLEKEEARIRAEESARQDVNDARRKTLRTVALVDVASLAPLAPEEHYQPDPSDEEDAPFLDPPDPLYLKHAKAIVAVLEQPIEKRLAAHEAVRAIRAERSLDTPDDHVVLRRLDKLIERLQAERPAAAGPATEAFKDPEQPASTPAASGGSVVNFLGKLFDQVSPARLINPNAVKTFGSTGDPE